MEVVLAVGAGLVVVLYVFQVFIPKIQGWTGSQPDPEERAAELLEEFRRQQPTEEKM